ncbi:hypothetical protein Tco_0970177 [Tanacetum coccineum]
MKWYDYGYLEDIKVRREDQKLYKFKEGDFPRLNMRNIEDMLILLVQNKIANLERDVIFDLNVALRMFTRLVVILKRVEDHNWESKATRISSISLSQRHSVMGSLHLFDLFFMIKAIDKLQLERRLMRNLEKFVSRRDYGEDFRTLSYWFTHTVLSALRRSGNPDGSSS